MFVLWAESFDLVEVPEHWGGEGFWDGVEVDGIFGSVGFSFVSDEEDYEEGFDG